MLNVSTTSVNNHGNAINQNGGELNISGGKVYLSSDKRTAFVSQAANAEHHSKTTFNVSELHVDANINLPEDEGGIERKTGAFTVSAGNVTVNADVFTVKVNDDVLADGVWQQFFTEKPEVLTREEKRAWLEIGRAHV